jgi:hypothetical protein
MRRIVLAAVVAGWGALIATHGFAQTNEACMLRCLDHLLYEACHTRCTKGAPPTQAPTISRAKPPTVAPAAASTSPSPAAALFAPPSSAQPAPAAAIPAALYPSVAQPAPQPSVQPPARPAAQPAADQAPPPRPVNQACVLHCLDHGRLYEQCEAVCAR